MRNTAVAFVLFSALVGCTSDDTTPGNDELAGENGEDGEQPKADGVDNFNFLELHQMHITCENIWCPRFELERANRTTTTCIGGGPQASCKVHDVDWQALGLSQTKINQIGTALEREASDPTRGTQVLVRGTYKSFVEFTNFEPTEVWLAQRTAGNSKGTFVRIFDRGIRCVTAPCPQFEEGRLNSTRQDTIGGFDFGVSADDSLQERVYDATSKPDGVIVVGDRTTRTAGSYVEELRSVNQAYLRIK